jgi:hypothetical protein
LKKRVLYFSIIFVAILLAGVIQIALSQYGEKNTAPLTGEGKPHFSVRWMGFAPDSNTTWPSVQPYANNFSDYYVCISDVISDKLILPVSLRLVNQESSSFFFRIQQNTSTSIGWITPTIEIGLVNRDETRFFTVTTERIKPSSIPEGTLSETITLTVQAYYDSAYTQFYSQDDVPVTFHFIDRTAAVWTVLSMDNFDTSEESHWSCIGPDYGQAKGITGDLYRSWPNSLKQTGYYEDQGLSGFGSTITINSSYTEAYVIASVKTSGWSTAPKVTFNGTIYFEPDVGPTQNAWYQMAFPLPTNQTTVVGICFLNTWAVGYLDDVYVIAKGA